jgi:diguanylate cyclase (GGDEF)-like protein
MCQDLFVRLKASARLPSPPGVALRILELTRSDEVSLEDMARTISSDPALASQILKFINSPMGGMGRRVSSLNEAVRQIGLRGVQLIALSFSLVSAGKRDGCPSFNYDHFWSRSLACAVAAKRFARNAGNIDANESFIVGLLYHIGQLAMACGIPVEYESVLQAGASSSSELLETESARLGQNHIQAGARLLEEWELPDAIWKTIAATAGGIPSDSRQPGATPERILATADVVATLLCDSKEERAPKVDEILRLVSRNFQITEAAWPDLYDQIVQEWQAYGNLLSVKTGKERPFRDLQDEARDHIAAISMATQMENQGIREENARLWKRSTLDGLTGVANRASFDDLLAGEIERCRRLDRPLSLCLIDIDHFKRFNDAHGHQAGDLVLRTVAETLDGSVRKADRVARYGGEEFAVILPDTGLDEAIPMAERLRVALETMPLRHQGRRLQVTASFGLASARWPGAPQTAEALVETADRCLYEAKRAGRNCCRPEPIFRKAA